jgi:hypothetical protein
MPLPFSAKYESFEFPKVPLPPFTATPTPSPPQRHSFRPRPASGGARSLGGVGCLRP